MIPEQNPNLIKLVRLEEEFFHEYRRAMSPSGERNRPALLRLSELCDEMARIHEAESAQLRRLAARAFELALTT